MFASVALPIALPPLTYRIPLHLRASIQIGKPVIVPLRKKNCTGYVTEILDSPPDSLNELSIKDIVDCDELKPLLDPTYFRFLAWIAEYYHYPVGEVVRSALPNISSPRKQRVYRLSPRTFQLSEEEEMRFAKRGGKRLSIIELIKEKSQISEVPSEYRNILRSMIKEEYIEESEEIIPPKFLAKKDFPNISKSKGLNDEQMEAFRKILPHLNSNEYKGFLLQGVTGSGKTEVYLSAAEYALGMNKSVMILIPEISLTPQLLARFQCRLGSRIAVLHSGLSEYERYEQWRLLHEGKAQVALGVRSTIFAPLKNLGVIIVDEEHESAFKQEDRLRYSARDMAMVRAQQEKCVVILGSATPSIESYHHVLGGKLERLSLLKRYAEAPMPNMEIVDLRQVKMEGTVSPRLAKQIAETLNNKKQAILFLNRRGYSSFVTCQDCGDVPKCKNCSVSLTTYKGTSSMECHYCGFLITAPKNCVECGSAELNFGGLGTESLEIELKEKFPSARIIRIDRETTKKKGTLEEKLIDVGKGNADIIIGTQMIAKGHDFPNIELVAIVNADVSINVPDFRASERAFQLFTQVSGRAGRKKDSKGRVLLQTYTPSHPSVQYAKAKNYDEFIRNELHDRLMFKYPPYYRLVRVLFTDANSDRARSSSMLVRDYLDAVGAEEVEILGPATAIINKLHNKFRWNLLLKAKSAVALNTLIKNGLPIWRKNVPSSTAVSVDVDPISLL